MRFWHSLADSGGFAKYNIIQHGRRRANRGRRERKPYHFEIYDAISATEPEELYSCNG
jgi:hypothetical protein